VLGKATVRGRLQPGAEITVKVDPNDHSRLIFVP
jgi:hypothetical protein